MLSYGTFQYFPPSCLESDMIIRGEADKFAHRILAFLLLGVARIYSKKVEFLLHDCDDMLDKLRRFTVDERVNKSISRTHRSYRSITLPDRFELDAFDLDISEDQDMSRLVTILGFYQVFSFYSLAWIS